jgi:hypothetical protein
MKVPIWTGIHWTGVPNVSRKRCIRPPIVVEVPACRLRHRLLDGARVRPIIRYPLRHEAAR